MNLALGTLVLLCLVGITLGDTRPKRRLVGGSSSADSDLERDNTTEPASTAHDGSAPSEGTTTTQPGPLQRRLRTKKGSRRNSANTSDQTREDSGPRYKAARTNKKKKLMSNAKLLTRLGLARVEPGTNHYRKRLVGTQKNEVGAPNYKGHQKRILENLDSRMYVIKLPPSSYYYAGHDYRIQDPVPKHSVNNLGINFSSNGKPSKVYHYNIPIINKVVGRKTNSNFYKYDDEINDPVFLGNGAGESSVYTVQNLEGHAGHAVNELGLPEDAKGYKKPYGKKPATYLKPKPAKQTFTKYFPSNGKPHAFYIIENSSTPYYHRLLP